MRERVVGSGANGVRELRRGGAEELPPRGDVEEDPTHLDRSYPAVVRPPRTPSDPPAANLDLRCRTRQRAALRRRNRETAAMLGRASPRNPNVAIAARSSKRPELARGVPLQCQERIVAIHPLPVVRDDDPSATPVLHADFDG